jgi:hypothetical protein
MRVSVAMLSDSDAVKSGCSLASRASALTPSTPSHSSTKSVTAVRLAGAFSRRSAWARISSELASAPLSAAAKSASSGMSATNVYESALASS